MSLTHFGLPDFYIAIPFNVLASREHYVRSSRKPADALRTDFDRAALPTGLRQANRMSIHSHFPAIPLFWVCLESQDCVRNVH
jgi:hypothetical protein